MAFYRVEKTRDYTVMANHHLRDERLSLKAKGLLSLILSLPDDWEISIQGLAAIGSDGIASVRSGMGELMEAGYVRRELGHAEGGTFAGYVYTIHEKPEEAPDEESPSCENRTTAPSCSFPTTENRTQSSKDKLSTIPPIVPHGDGGKGGNPSVSDGVADSSTPLSVACGDISPRRGESSLYTREPRGATKRKRRGARSAPDWEPEMFNRFWKAYPRGEDKQGAMDEWDRLRPDHETMLAMSRALCRQKASDDWQRGIGIPYAVRWLRRRRWEDEDKTPPRPPDRSSGGDLPVWT